MLLFIEFLRPPSQWHLKFGCERPVLSHAEICRSWMGGTSLELCVPTFSRNPSEATGPIKMELIIAVLPRICRLCNSEELNNHFNGGRHYSETHWRECSTGLNCLNNKVSAICKADFYVFYGTMCLCYYERQQGTTEKHRQEEESSCHHLQAPAVHGAF